MLNDLGVDQNECLDDVPHPHDVMPIATYIENDGSTRPLIQPPYKRKDPPAELFEVPTSVTNPKPEPKKKEEKKTPHHIAYEIATGKNNPFAVGGTENILSIGGSENLTNS